MTEEQKNLLMRDLCARLPYGVKISVEARVETLESVDMNDYVVGYSSWLASGVEYVKPYLLPLSSMTEEQYDELERTTSNDYMDHMRITNELREKVEFITHWPLYSPDIIDWFNRNHFDYRGLIEMGLAEDATGKNIY